MPLRLLICLLLSVQIIAAVKIDLSEFSPIETLSIGSFKTQVFNITGAIVAQPVIFLEKDCSAIEFNDLFQAYQFELSIKVDENPLLTAGRTTYPRGKIGHFELIKVQLDISRKYNGIFALVPSNTAWRQRLILQCSTLMKCRNAKISIYANLNELKKALRFKIVGRVQGNVLSFSDIPIVMLHSKLNCSIENDWILVQKRVDSNLNFHRNWNSYEKGFGDPDENFWIGLEKLHAITVKNDNPAYKCKMRLDAEDWNGKSYWGEWSLFRVLGAKDRYRLNVGVWLNGTYPRRMSFWSKLNNTQFFTYDNSFPGKKCTVTVSGGGWWFPDNSLCGSNNINGYYSSPLIRNNQYVCNTIEVGPLTIPIKKSIMKLNCSSIA